MTINIENEATEELDFDYRKLMGQVIEQSLDYENCPYEAEINVVLTNNEEIQETNKRFREIDSPTDVLSFPMIEYNQPSDFSEIEDYVEDYFNPESGELMLGDIMISIDKVKEQAVSYGHSLERELAFLTAHSMLHLCGYDHMVDEERIVMEQKQKEILEILKITR